MSGEVKIVLTCILLGAVGLTGGVITVSTLLPEIFGGRQGDVAGVGLVLLAIVSAYFFLQHHRTTRKRAGRWKELMVGAGFAGGTLFFVVARAELSLGLICLGMEKAYLTTFLLIIV